jgi:hypothetical protein
MKARQLIDSATYDPQQLNALRTAFDAAWKQISPAVRARGVEAARLKLANVVLAVAPTGPIEADRIAADAMNVMLAGPTELTCRKRHSPHRAHLDESVHPRK